MHIPDGYLGPITCIAGFAAMVPVWAIASRTVKRTLSARQVPLLAIGAAFSFVIMMFNIPIPGGTTGHAVGGVLVAILLGPWAACIAGSTALIIQALLFGDGGITAIGANCFNMAFVMPFTGYLVYRLVSAGSGATAVRRVFAAGLAGYCGLVAASLCAGIEFGIQPILHHTASGQSLYCPYGLSVAIPTMVGEHLLIFGWVELIVTALVVKYLQKQDSSMLQLNGNFGKMKIVPKLAIGLAVLAVLTPIGIIIPAKLNAGTAWGEWGPDELRMILGFVPAELKKVSSLWNSAMPDYAFKGWEIHGIGYLSLAYIVAALVGIVFCVGIALFIGKILSRKES